MYSGLLNRLMEFAESHNYTILSFIDKSEEDSTTLNLRTFIASLSLPITLREYQFEAFAECIRSRRKLILSPTASGKSLIIYCITRKILNEGFKRGLILVPVISLVEQLADDFTDYGWGLSATDMAINKIHSGALKDIDSPLTISTWQSLYNMPSHYFHQFDFVIGDEAHLFKAKSLCGIMENLINTKYRIGTSGTLDGTKVHQLVLEGLFGPVHKTTTTADLIEQGIISKLKIECLLLKYNQTTKRAAKHFDYQQEKDFLITHEKRNAFIANLGASLKGNSLILYQEVEKQGKPLYELLKARKRQSQEVHFIYGNTPVKEREAIRALVEMNKEVIIVASYGTFQTGINMINLNNLIFATPSKSKIRVFQSIGRALRKGEFKGEATLYDLADDLRWKQEKDNYTLHHFMERIKMYDSENLPYQIHKVDLE
jgi:superfamily II DNA or RNA helicase